MTDDSVRWQRLTGYLGAAVSLTGIQLVAPALPAIQSAYDLTTSEAAAVMTWYLIPGVVVAIPAGFVADKFGRRLPFTLGFAVFGLMGALIVFQVPYELFLLARIIQGAAFAAVLPLTITILGDLSTGRKQVVAQGNRSVVMKAADAVFPVVGGITASIAWYLPFFGQLMAIPVALLGWFTLNDVSYSESNMRQTFGSFINLFRGWAVWSFQLTGFTRFFFSLAFIVLTPIYLVNDLHLSTTFAGLTLGIASLAGTICALLSGPLSKALPPSGWMALAPVGIGIGFMILGAVESPLGLLIGAACFGAAEGLYGVFQNSIVTRVAGDDLRATFVAGTGAIRNLGKFAAPAIIGLTLYTAQAGALFLGLGVLSLIAIGLARPLAIYDSRVLH